MTLAHNNFLAIELLPATESQPRFPFSNQSEK